jgi:hypothetical protein
MNATGPLAPRRMASEERTNLWLPLLGEGAAVPAGVGGLAERVNAALDDIAEALALPGPAAPKPYSRWPADLADGPAGAALFFHYLDQARPGKGYGEQASAYLEAAIAATAEAVSLPGLFTGFPGVAWTLEHLTGRLLAPPAIGEADAGAEVARALVRYLRHLPRYEGYDLFHGLAGLGIWALERGPWSGAAEAMDSVVRELAEHAERCADGITWHSPPERLTADERATYPQGCYKLGVAHGVPGVIGVLGGMLSAGLDGGAARELLVGAVEWLLRQALPPGASSCFPGAVAPGIEPRPARLGWCRGDGGVALALLVAARAAGKPEWERQALAVARAAAGRPVDPARACHSGLCHGAAGIAHLFNRLFHATGDPLFEAEAVAWIERLLALRQPGLGLAGWLFWRVISKGADPDPGVGWLQLPVPGFLTGVAGVGLALLGAVSPIEPAWDRVMLCSAPPSVEPCC